MVQESALIKGGMEMSLTRCDSVGSGLHVWQHSMLSACSTHSLLGTCTDSYDQDNSSNNNNLKGKGGENEEEKV